MSEKRIEEIVYRNAIVLFEEKGYVSPVELLVKMDCLKSKEVEDWRFKRIPYLERVIACNLRKVNLILQTLKKFAGEQNLKPSITVYKSWGKGPKKLLRFSKTGNADLEKLFSTSYVLEKN